MCGRVKDAGSARAAQRLALASPVAKTTGEGDRPPKSGWWKGRGPVSAETPRAGGKLAGMDFKDWMSARLAPREISVEAMTVQVMKDAQTARDLLMPEFG
jgi:hypothetical protein